MPSNIRVRKKHSRKVSSTDINLLVNTETDDVYYEWDRNKIVKALKEEGGVGERTARHIAKSVEDRVLGSGITKITTSLIREMVDIELFELGHQKKLVKQTSIGLPKSDIEELIFSKSQENSNIGTNNPEAIQHSLSETILKQYALQEIFSEEVSEAHKTGKVHVHDLGYPTRVYAFSKNTELKIKIGDGKDKIVNLEELYHIYSNSEEDIYVLDRNSWVKLHEVICYLEHKDMVEFDLGKHKIKVSDDHGCVVMRDDKTIIIRADEVLLSDKFIKIC